jgi:hypothetical protein
MDHQQEIAQILSEHTQINDHQKDHTKADQQIQGSGAPMEGV